MKHLGTAALLFLCLTTSYLVIEDRKEREGLIQENQQLRDYNTRRERRLFWMQAPKSINVEAVQAAFHIVSTPPSVVAALLYCENGPINLETGSIDKSDFVAKNLPLSQWSTVDGARTLNRLLWDWLLNTKDGKQAQKSFFMAAAKPYTAMSLKEQQSWARNMMAAQARFSKEIRFEEEKPLIQPMRTPTETR